MDSENQEAIYCEDDGEYKIYCSVCDKLCKEQFYKNHLKSGTHLNKLYRKQRIKKINCFYSSNCL